MPVQFPALPFPTQLPANTAEKAANGPSAWAPETTTNRIIDSNIHLTQRINRTWMEH